MKTMNKVSILFAVVPMIISGWALHIATKANGLAHRSLEITEQSNSNHKMMNTVQARESLLGTTQEIYEIISKNRSSLKKCLKNEKLSSSDREAYEMLSEMYETVAEGHNQLSRFAADALDYPLATNVPPARLKSLEIRSSLLKYQFRDFDEFIDKCSKEAT